MAILLRTYALVFLFVIRLRFPTGVAVSEIIRKRYNDDVLKRIRQYEKLDYKLRKAELDLNFLNVCQERSLTPKFLQFRVANQHLRNSAAYDQCSRLLLQEEIKRKKSTIRNCKKECERLKTELQSTLSHFDFVHVYSLFIRGNDVKLCVADEKQQRKLGGLADDPATSHDPDAVIFNYSSYELSDDEKRVLSLGLNFSLPPQKLNLPSHLVPFELLFRQIKDASFSRTSDNDQFKTDLKHLSFKTYRDYKFKQDLNISHHDYSLLDNLSKNKDLVIQKTDKGNSVVLLNRVDYDNSMLGILSDTSKFKKVNIPSKKTILTRGRLGEVSTIDSGYNKGKER